MSTLKDYLMEHSDLNEDQALLTIELTKKYLDDKLPSVMHKNLKSIFEGNTLEDSIKDRFSELGKDVHSKTDDLAQDLKDAINKTLGRS